MKATVSIHTDKGLYEALQINGTNLKVMLAQIIPAIEKLPDEIDGASLFDWTKINIAVER